MSGTLLEGFDPSLKVEERHSGGNNDISLLFLLLVSETNSWHSLGGGDGLEVTSLDGGSERWLLGFNLLVLGHSLAKGALALHGGDSKVLSINSCFRGGGDFHLSAHGGSHRQVFMSGGS